MVDADLVAAKLAELRNRIDRVRAHAPQDETALAEDADALDLVSFNLLLCVQAALDVGSHIIADESWTPAATLGETFDRLHECGVLTADAASAMRKAAGLRNIVAHGYAAVDVKMVFTAATNGLADLDRFASEVASWAKTRS
jgi:uncharacterized protein YutE (UPF0331/DUF86 family)